MNVKPTSRATSACRAVAPIIAPTRGEAPGSSSQRWMASTVSVGTMHLQPALGEAVARLRVVDERGVAHDVEGPARSSGRRTVEAVDRDGLHVLPGVAGLQGVGPHEHPGSLVELREVVQRLGDLVARAGLELGGDGVLEVEHDRVCAGVRALSTHAGLCPGTKRTVR